jgi:fatty-acid desaturase
MIILLYGYIFYYVAALVGISIGYHRYFTHRSFKTSMYVETIMLFFGLICGGRSALTWAAVHRIHHSKSDTEDATQFTQTVFPKRKSTMKSGLRTSGVQINYIQKWDRG